MLGKLLEMGVPAMSEAKDGQSCLTLAISKSDVTICRHLMAAGPRIDNLSTTRGRSHLRRAIECDRSEIIRALLRHSRYARHQESSFAADLRFAIRRYAESACPFEAIGPWLDKALEKSGGNDDEPLAAEFYEQHFNEKIWLSYTGISKKELL